MCSNHIDYAMTKIRYQFLILSFTTLFALLGCEQTNSDHGTVNIKSDLSEIDQESLNYISNSLDIKYRVLSNIETGCPDRDRQPVKHCFSAYIDFTSPQDINVVGWSIFYSQVYPIYASESDVFNIEFINGDIHKITPTAMFNGFKEGQTQSLKVYMAATHLSHSQLMPNYWITGSGLTSAIIESTRTTIDPETKLALMPWIAKYDNIEKQIKSHPNDVNKYASTSVLFDQNADVQIDKSHLSRTVIPTPKKLEVNDESKLLNISSGFHVSYEGLDEGDVSAAFERLQKLGVQQTTEGIPLNITIAPSEDGVTESYHLKISEQGISIVAQDTAGAFYAVQTITSLLDVLDKHIPLVTIEDAPGYRYRGQHVDFSRNFYDKTFVFRLIEQMAAYKLNKLHMHLADDEGWRIELPSLPELTTVGAFRCMDIADKNCMQPQLGGADAIDRDGYYSAQDYIEILKYASRHHIEVIPSLDMPGHSRAAIKAMEARYRFYMRQEDEKKATEYLLSDFNDKTEYRSIQNYNDNTINACLESSYTFIDRVLDDLIALHKAANHPLNIYHIGADETAGAWVESAACKALIEDANNDVNDINQLTAHFIERVSYMVASKGIAVGGWNDGLGKTRTDKMPSEVYSYIWGALPWGAHAMANEQAHRGWNVVLSIPDVFYLDFPYEVDPEERGYNWASRQTNSRTIFNFMPDNLPVHAEFRLNTLGHNFELDDTVHSLGGANSSHNTPQESKTHRPLPKGYRVAGIQGQLWSETIRSSRQAEYMLFPRIIALAERAWHTAYWAVPYNYSGEKYDKDTSTFTPELRAKRDRSWQHFANAVAQKELIKLDKLGVFYRIPTVGAKIVEGTLTMNSSLPGIQLEYREQDDEWKSYQHPVLVEGNVYVRARSAMGDRAGRSKIVE